MEPASRYLPSAVAEKQLWPWQVGEICCYRALSSLSLALPQGYLSFSFRYAEAGYDLIRDAVPDNDGVIKEACHKHLCSRNKGCLCSCGVWCVSQSVVRHPQSWHTWVQWHGGVPTFKIPAPQPRVRRRVQLAVDQMMAASTEAVTSSVA